MSHLTPQYPNDRGFKHMPPINGAYGGAVVVYESSAALAPHIWLRAHYEDGDATIHLSVEAAQCLAEQLTWLIEHHYQGGAS